MPNKERRWQTPGKKGQLRSSLNVSRRQARIKISARRRTRAIRTPMRSNHSTGAKAPDKARVRKDWEQQERELETRRGTYLNVKAREEQEKVETNRRTYLNVTFREPVRQAEQTETKSRPEAKGTGETWAETRRK